MQLVRPQLAGLLSRPGVQARPARRISHVARFLRQENGTPSHRWPTEEGLPLSLFVPYKSLPPDGTTVPAEEEMCDPEESRCKTVLHVYEARCRVCSGTGWSRAPSNGKRGHLSTCMLCHGLGYVRRTTSRFCPDDPDKHLTIARPLTWRGKFAARLGLGGRGAKQQQQQQQQHQQQQHQQQQGGPNAGGNGNGKAP